MRLSSMLRIHSVLLMARTTPETREQLSTVVILATISANPPFYLLVIFVMFFFYPRQFNSSRSIGAFYELLDVDDLMLFSVSMSGV